MARFFISHVTTEAPVASLIARWLGSAGTRPFVASKDISAGQLWLQSLRESLAHADVVLVLTSRRSAVPGGPMHRLDAFAARTKLLSHWRGRLLACRHG